MQVCERIRNKHPHHKFTLLDNGESFSDACIRIDNFLTDIWVEDWQWTSENDREFELIDEEIDKWLIRHHFSYDK